MLKTNNQIEELRFNIELWDEKIISLHQEGFQIISLCGTGRNPRENFSHARRHYREEMAKKMKNLRIRAKGASFAWICREKTYNLSLEKSFQRV